jgi:hypothetical protein
LRLDELDLDYVLLGVNYKSDFPKFSVVQQDPLPGEKSKWEESLYQN